MKERMKQFGELFESTPDDEKHEVVPAFTLVLLAAMATDAQWNSAMEITKEKL
jgi:hypothetical protein